MDDGSSSTQESVKMLQILAKSGVQRVVLTPHFYRQNEDIASFLERRKSSYERLLEVVKATDGLPGLALGAEVNLTVL